MGKECGAWVSRRLWGGGNTSPLKTTAWEAISSLTPSILQLFCRLIKSEDSLFCMENSSYQNTIGALLYYSFIKIVD